MAKDSIPDDAISSLSKVLESEEQLAQDIESLGTKKSLGSVVFFDLVGSTGYRRQYGPEKGLEKAFLHNVQVSRQIARHDGVVPAQEPPLQQTAR